MPYIFCRGVLNLGALYFPCRRVLSKAQLARVQNPDPLVQTGLRIIRIVCALRTKLVLSEMVLSISAMVLCGSPDTSFWPLAKDITLES